jgi:predicted dehydrogenase
MKVSSGEALSKLKTVIIGLGQIGQGYDYERADSSVILTHAKAVSLHDDFELSAGVDLCAKKRKNFEKKYSKPAYANIQEIRNVFKPDIIAIAVPLPFHFPLFNESLVFEPKGIVCEKPLAKNIDEAKRMIESARALGCAVSVNYSRRFNPEVHKLKNMIDAGVLGAIYKVMVWYTKGIEGNGSHFINMLQLFFGDMKSATILKVGEILSDGDPELDLHIRFKGVDVYMLNSKDENFYMGKVEFVGINGLAVYEDGKSLQYSLAVENSMFHGEKRLVKQSEIEGPSDKDIFFTYNNLAQHLKNGEGILSTLETATSTLQIVEGLVSQSKEK